MSEDKTMSESVSRVSGAGAPVSWSTVLGRAGLVGAVAFAVLQGKEWVDAGRFDTPGTAADGLLVAGGTFLVYAMLKVLKL